MSGVSMHYQSSEWVGTTQTQHQALLESDPLLENTRARAEFMKQIERDVIQVHGLFADVHEMVNEQQTMVDAIDMNISETEENARAGMEQLLQAQAYQAAKRRKMCCLVLMTAVAFLIFCLFLWVAFGGNN